MEKRIKNFKQLNVWRDGHLLVLAVYQQTNSLPTEEKFGLISQMRRSAVSIPANIAEGFKRNGIKDKLRFYNIAQSSLEELRYYFVLCKDLNYKGQYISLEENAEQVAKMLAGLIKSLTIHK